MELARAGMGFQWVGAQVVSVLTQFHHGTTPEDIALGRLEEAGACLAAACLSKTLYPSCSLEVGNGWEPGDLRSSPRTVPDGLASKAPPSVLDTHELQEPKVPQLGGVKGWDSKNN